MSDKTAADKFKETLAGVTADETVKNTLLETFNEVNRKAGEFGRRIIEKDTENEQLREKEKTWSKAYETLRKHNVDADQIPKILEKMGVQKTLEEEHALAVAALESKAKEMEKLAKEAKTLKAEKAVKGIFERMRSEFKDEQGKPIKISEKLIDYDKLFDITDLANETVLQEKCKQVLNEALTKQVEIFRDAGFQGVKLPEKKTPEGSQESVSHNLADIEKIYKEHGAAAAIHADRERRAKAQG